KGVVQLFTVLLWCWWVPSESLLLTQIGLPPEVAYPLTAFWVVGLINAMNMIDGMDAEAGGFSLIALMSFTLVAASTEYGTALSAVMGAVLGFLAFNKPPAKVYLGETGSTFL